MFNLIRPFRTGQNHRKARRSVLRRDHQLPAIETLEARVLLAAGGFDLGAPAVDEPADHGDGISNEVAGTNAHRPFFETQNINGKPFVFTWDPPVPESTETQEAMPLAAAVNPLDSMPALHSNPGAAASLFLDFDGHIEPYWGGHTDATTPVYDRDGDATTFSDGELADIHDIWQRVSEDFAPFNIDVTTVEPAVLAEGVPIDDANGIALRVAIGGSWQDWYGSRVGGVAYISAFTNSRANVVYVFLESGRNSYFLGETTSHEAGHGFGLYHQSSYDAKGAKIEYNPGDGYWAPIMGGGRPVVSTWHNGTSQDDMAILAGTRNGFGFRSDDHGNSIAAATALSTDGTTWSSVGLIETNDDVDVFSFTIAAEASYWISGDVAAVGPNLDFVIELRDSAGGLIRSADPQETLRAEIVESLTPGDYFVVVTKSTTYGWVGQYSVSIVAPPPGIAVTSATLPLMTGENGWSTTFTVNLDTPPTADVIVPISSSDLTEGTVSAASLTFTSANWYAPQTVMVTGVNDDVVDGDVAYSVVIGPATSADPDYSGLDPGDISLINLDITTTTYNSTDVNKALKDRKGKNNGKTDSTLTIPDSFNIVDLNVQLDITHTWDEDLDVFLISPAGTRKTLFTDVGGNFDNFTDTILDDQASTFIRSGTAPFTGTFQPKGFLSDFNGENMAGTWTLEIQDDTRGDVGTLNNWSISVTHPVPGPNDPPLAGADTATTDEDTAVVIDALANDTDPNSDPLTVTSFDAVSTNGASVSVAPDGGVTYDPSGSPTLQALQLGQSLVDTFSYTIGDGNGGFSSATVTVTVNGLDEAAGVTVTGVSPNSASPNEQLTVTVTGSGFVDGATVDFGTRLNVQSVTFISSTQLDVLIKVHRRAADGPRDVTLTNPDGSFDVCADCFTVGAPSSSSATSAQSSGPVQSFNLSGSDETSTETSFIQPTDPTLLFVEPVSTEEELDDQSPTEGAPATLPEDQADLDSLFGDLDGSLLEDLLTV